MMFPIPFLENQTVSDVLAVTLTSVLAGVVTTIVIYSMDKFRENIRKSKLEIQLVRKTGMVVEYKKKKKRIDLKDAYMFLDKVNDETIEKIKNTEEQQKKKKKEIKNSRDLLNEKILELKQITKGK